jgi:outer membrane protein OmpA-like peptidoglycan-associated protein
MALCAGAYKLVLVWSANRAQTAASDSKVNTVIRIGGDGYLGYFFAQSPRIKLEAAKRGMAISFNNDGGDYAGRLKKFAAGEYDAIVLPVNSYLTHGQQYNYPGVITEAISDSKGADAMACFVGPGTQLPADPKVQDLNNASLQIVYTGESPSSFLLDLTIADFDLFNLSKTDSWRVEVSGSEQAYQKATKHQGDCFVMWEPDVQHALRDVPGLKRVWGSDKFDGYIVDVFVFRRNFISDHQDDVIAFFASYFQTMRFYAGDRDSWVRDMVAVSGLRKDEVEKIMQNKEIHWYDLNENLSRQFGLNTGGVAAGAPVEGVVNTINACTDVLQQTHRLQSDPLGGDPYKIVNSKILEAVQSQLPKFIGSENMQRTFTALSDDDWKGLHEIGVMRVTPITFDSGTAQLDDDGAAQVDEIAKLLINNYPDDRVVIRGHTGPGSDEQANVDLSQQRAEAVMQRLIQQRGIDANRLRAQGVGSSQPPPKRPGENPRAYQYRLPRVEFDLYEDVSSF